MIDRYRKAGTNVIWPDKEHSDDWWTLRFEAWDDTSATIAAKELNRLHRELVEARAEVERLRAAARTVESLREADAFMRVLREQVSEDQGVRGE